MKPGRNVVVRPDGGLDLVSTAPRNNLNQVYSAMGLQDSYEEHDRNYAQYRAPRYLAFSDSHLDSLQNPAYATEFRQRSGRLYLMPSFITQADTGFFTDELDPRDRTRGDLNYTLSPQLSYFTPLGSRFVVGGGATLAKTDLRGNGADIYSQDGIYRRYDGTTRFTTLNLSVIAARRFGEAERTSVGLKFDYIDDQSMYAVTTSESDNSSGQVERGDSRVRRLGFSVGLTHDFGGDKKLGLYYHYDTGTVRGQERRTDFYTTAEPGVYRYVQLNSASTKPKYTSEIGIRFRASLTPRLFYGVEGSLLLDRGRLTREGLNDLIESTLDRRATLGVGFGYALRPRTILIADLTAGFKREGDRERTDFYSNYFRDGRLVDRRLDGFTEDDRNDRYLYGSMHLGAQTDLWRNFFAGGSAIIVGYKRTYKYRYVSEYFPYPRNDRSYRYLRSSQYYTYDFNIGRRLKPGWTMQYAYEPGLGVDAPSHSVILRYDFGGKKRESY
ncbi:MAG TPA: hypothetical protein VJ302_27620 [Blastocatellia bacterium]|nr:hypothetical protein [Blastocatellia bacterium]